MTSHPPLLQLFKELRRHKKLENRRNPMFEKNRFAKFFIYFFALFWIGYLIFFGIMFKFLFAGIFSSMEPYHIMSKGFIYLLIVDFLLRYSAQKPPTQEIKPYLLLPIKRNKILNYLLGGTTISAFNLIWLFMLVPFALLTITRFYGIPGVLGYCFGFWLLALLNNFWYLLCRTLINERFIYLLLPLLTYGLLLIAEFGFDFPISNFTMNLGEAFIEGNILAYLGVAAVIALLWWINYRIMTHNLYSELSKTPDTKVKNVSEYKFLERYGEVGEYFRLELKLLLRNKRSKYMLFMSCGFIIMLTAMLFTEAYEGPLGKSFVGFYNFSVLGIMILTQLMSFEGSYLDGLMSRKESIYTLLKAKYYFYSICLIIPLILMTPAIIMGKMSLFMAISYLFFTTGFIYCLLFQLAVYNNKTTPLNENLMGRQASGTAFQSVISLLAFGLPLLITSVLRALCSETATLWILLISGIILTLTSNLWMKNIYKRFMKRRYKNMEGFRLTR